MLMNTRSRTHRLHLEELESRLLLTFFPPVNYSTAPFATTVAAADFNGDDAIDLAVANSSFGNGNTVGIRLNSGNGTFGGVTNVNAGDGIYWVTAGDMNADGRMDLVAANLTGRVNVLRGNGNGTFQPPIASTTGPFAVHVAIGDLNTDGRQDLVVASANSHSVNVLLGNGNGTFQPFARLRAGVSPYGVALGDFNGDDVPDIVVANLRTLNSTVHVLIGNGDGTFRPKVLYHAGGRETRHVEVADVNADGNLDIVAGNSGSNSISTLLGNGDGTFANARYFEACGAPMHFAIADFDGNSTLDVATVDYTYPVGHDCVLPGLGDGTLGRYREFTVGNSPFSLAAADLSGDDIPDLAIVNTYSANMSVLINVPERSAPAMFHGKLVPTHQSPAPADAARAASQRPDSPQSESADAVFSRVQQPEVRGSSTARTDGASVLPECLHHPFIRELGERSVAMLPANSE
jgi:hypothetical protein